MADPVFTRSGSYPANPPFLKNLCDCLYTWQERRFLAAKIQLTQEWKTNSLTKGNLVFEQFIDVFSERLVGEISQEALEKPVDLTTLPDLYSRHKRKKWAYAISTCTFTRPVDTSSAKLNSVKPGTKVFALSHAVTAFDLIHRRLAGACFVPSATPDVPNVHPLVMVAFAARKLLDALRGSLTTVHILTPMTHGPDMEFLPWLLYALRDQTLAQTIAAAPNAPSPHCLLSPAEMFFFGLTGKFDDLLGRTPVFPKLSSPHSPLLLIGLNFGFMLKERKIDINFRFCGAGAEKGPPHIDTEIQDRGGAGARITATKLADHYPVDLAKVKEFELGFSFLSYVSTRPGANWEQMLGAAEIREHLGLELAIVNDPALTAVSRRIIGARVSEFPNLVRAFNIVSHVNPERFRVVQLAINAAIRDLWSKTTTPESRESVAERVLSLHWKMMETAHELLNRNDTTPIAGFETLLDLAAKAVLELRGNVSRP